MSNIFANKKTVDDTAIETDRVGGGTYLRDTGLYKGVIKAAYLKNAQHSKSVSLNIIIELADGQEVRDQIWMSNSKGELTYVDKRTGKTEDMIGYKAVNSFSKLLLGKPLKELDQEERTLNLYDFTAGGNVPQAVECFVEFHNVPVQICLQRAIEDRVAKSDVTGNWEPTGETKEVNNIIKIMHGDKPVTTADVDAFIKSKGGTFQETLEADELGRAIAAMPDESEDWFSTKWNAKYEGEVYNASKGAPKTPGQAFKPADETKKAKATSLFD